MDDDRHNAIEWTSWTLDDWTMLEISENGMAFAFERATGQVYKLPHKDCPFTVTRDLRRQSAPASTASQRTG